MCRYPASLLSVFCALFTAAPAGAAVVTTADNASTAGDGKTSLLEAITSVQENETISFNIPGEGPHYILTPLSGYPLIEKGGVTIDGYTQPGASANTAAPDQPKNAKIKIVLDSRTPNPGLERRTVLNYPGFGDSESCVLGLKDASNVTIRGLSFIGVPGGDDGADPYVYCVALVKESKNARIQGCWFGLDPAMTSWRPNAEGIVEGIHGSRAAVSSFKWENDPETGLTYDSGGVIFGVDGDGTGDAGEGNVCAGMLLPVHLATPDAVVAGNWFNFLPDGSLLDVVKQNFTRGDEAVEAIENGDGTNMRIGTDGNGVSDPEEGNRFGHVTYDVFVEFWRAAPGAVIAGNTFGFSLDGMPAFDSPDTSLATMRSGSTLRFGTDGNGTSDALEANRVSGTGRSFFRMNGQTRISFRGNILTGNYGAAPFDDGAGITPDVQYSDVLADPSVVTTVVLNSSSAATSLAGEAPLQTPGNEPPVLDLYLADPFGLYDSFSQGRKWLASYNVDGAGDTDASEGKFRFDITALGLTADDVGRLTATANYTLPHSPEEPVLVVTTSFSPTIQSNVPRPPALGGVSLTKNGVDLALAWTGGTAPFRVYAASSPAGPWAPVSTVNAQTTTITPAPDTKPREFYLVREGAIP